jgi:alpha-ribazole phosphatase/probable phosphoglycerate mutase
MQDPRLRECNYGELNGAPADRVHAVRSLHIDTPFPAGQSYRDVIGRVAEFVRDLQRDWDGKRVLIIGHSATRWSLQCLLGGARLEDLIEAPFEWQPGWEFVLPGGWTDETKASPPA